MNTRKGEDDDHSSAWAILDNILGRLAVKDEVKTSFLSREWRNKWVHLSKLLFDR